MKKFKIRSIYAIIFVFILTLGIGFSAWIITHNIKFYPDYQIDAEWEKYLGGQSKFVGSGTLLPDTKNSSIVNVTSSNLGGYTVEYKLQTSSSFESGSPTAAGEYHLRYTKGDEIHIITFYVVATENYVCYIDSDTEANRYASIEEALSVAKANTSANTIYTRINKYGSTNIDIIIRSDCEIGSGDTLYLQCGLSVTRSNKEKGSVSGSPIYDENGVLTEGRNYGVTEVDPINRANTKVVIGQGIILTNNGTIVVDGQISSGYGGAPSASHTCGIDSSGTWADYQTKVNTANENVLYSVLCLDKDAIINSYGNIECYGFIFELDLNNGSELIMNSGTLYMPFVLRDFRGGSAMYAVYQSIDEYHSSAFNEYAFENISCKTKITYNANLSTWGNLWANDQNNHTVINMISNNQTSTDYVIELTNPNGYVISKYNPDTQIMTLDIYGGAETRSMGLKVQVGFTVTVSTADVYFPISWRYKISLNKLKNQEETTYTMDYRYKLMPGAELTVSEGAILNIDELIAYTSYAGNESLMPGTKYPVIYQYGALAGTPVPNAKITNNGTINADCLAGKVYSTVTGAKMTIRSSASITSYEPKQHSGSSFLASMSAWHEIKEILLINLYKSSGVSKDFTYAAIGTYTSKKYAESDEYAGWLTSSLAFYFDANGGTFPENAITETEFYTVSLMGKKIDDLIINSITVPSREHFTFGGWSSSPTTYIDPKSDVYYVSTYIYAYWIPIEYNINIIYGYDENCKDGNGEITNLDGSTPFVIIEQETKDPNKFTALTNKRLLTPKNSNNYVFSGWFIDQNYETPINSLIGTNYLSDSQVTIYGKWYPAGTETYTINYVMVNANTNILTLFNFTSSEIVSLDINKYDFPDNCFKVNENTEDNILIEQYFEGWKDEAGNSLELQDVINLLNNLYETNKTKEESEKVKTLTIYGHWQNKIEVVLSNTNGKLYCTPNMSFVINSDSTENINASKRTVWFTNKDLNNTTFFIDGETYSDGLNSTISNFDIDNNRLTLYGDLYYLLTSNDFTEKVYNGNEQKLLFYKLDFNLFTTSVTASANPGNNLGTTNAEDTSDEKSTFRGKAINKIIIVNCTGATTKLGVTASKVVNWRVPALSWPPYTTKYFAVTRYCGLFDSVTGLTQVILGDTNAKDIIGDYAFSDCSITSIIGVAEGSITQGNDITSSSSTAPSNTSTIPITTNP